MENRKPPGRPVRKYGKSQVGDIKSRRSDGKTYNRPEKRPGVRSDRPSGRLVVKKVKPEERPYIRPEKSEGKNVPKIRKRGSKGIQKVVTEIRLNRYIANSGVCSRRDADEHIKNGLITVNGHLVTDLGTKVTYDDMSASGIKGFLQKRRCTYL